MVTFDTVRRVVGLLLGAAYVGSRFFDQNLRLDSDKKAVRQLFAYPALVLTPRTRRGQLFGAAVAVGFEAGYAAMQAANSPELTLETDPKD